VVVLPPFTSVTVSLSLALSFCRRLRAFRTALKPRFESLSLALVFTPAASVFRTGLKRKIFEAFGTLTVAPAVSVAAGDGLIAPTITKRLIEQFARMAPPSEPPPGLAELTPRELEVLTLVARGLSNRELAAELVISEATVKTHVKRVLSKLGARDRVQAVVVAYEAGLVAPGDAAQRLP
jgi:DNA-binding NarL/FixJ family response regulator